MKPKSPGLALVLTFLFGPFGLFYSSIIGGFTMLALIILMAVVLPNSIIAALGLWAFTMLWGYKAAQHHNEDIDNFVNRIRGE